ncbi:MAG: 8-oxo-dGTP diphosphatase MutT [Magnetococcales bacterium]|nr:8-oxo-dGTP diphosphatase MutT [Magnetococcales bacterium]
MVAEESRSPHQQLPMLTVAAALIIDERGRILLSQRRKDAHLGMMWEFPGGKVESGETAEAAVIRELQEELNITPDDPEPWRFVTHDYDRFYLLMLVFKVVEFSGTPTVQESETRAIGWFAPSELASLAFPPANAPLLTAIQRMEHHTPDDDQNP